MQTKIYQISNLDCPHCAAKIEKMLAAHPQIQQVNLALSTKLLRIVAEDPDALLPEIVSIAKSAEPAVEIAPREEAHHHHHGDGECCCGHEHHHHEDGECCCGHEHHHHGCRPESRRQVFLIENLDCAHCAAKIEEKISLLPEVEAVTLTFATKQLRVTAPDPEGLLPVMLELARTVEPAVEITPRDTVAGNKRVYLIENLDCAHCAAKIEEKIAALPEVKEVTLTFATKQLRVTADDPDALLPRMLEIAKSVEPEATIRPRDPAPAAKKPAAKQESGGLKLSQMLIGAAIFAVGMVFEDTAYSAVTLVACIVAYALLVAGVLKKAFANLLRGKALDENFLMSVASLGAICVGNFPEAVGVMLFYRVGEYFEEKAVARSRGQIMDAVDLRPEVVNRVNGTQVEVIPAERAKVGDVVLVRPGDRIPLDGVVLSGDSRIDTAPLTGEPVPVHVTAGSEVLSGCVNTSGQLTVRVQKELSESMVTRILDSVENAAASKPKIDRFITRFAKYYTPAVVAIAIATALIPPAFTGEWKYWIYTSMTFLVMSCPCALVLSVPLAFFSGIGAGSKKGILFKGGTSMEAMDKVQTVIMDKTGTITKGEFRVQQVVGNPRLLQLCASCEQQSTHPIAVSIVAAAKEQGMQLLRPTSLEEIAGKGLKAKLEAHEILCGNAALMEAFGIEYTRAPGAGTRVLIAVDGRFAGEIIIDDTLKETAVEAIAALKKRGIQTVMLTGDAEPAAKAIAEQAGIDRLYAGLLPDDKLRILQEIRAERGAIMYVGDGINDAPVLAGADVGAAMGSGADAAIEAADVVFMTSDPAAIPQSLAIAHRTGRVAWGNVVFALAVKFLAMLLGLLGFASMWMAVFADTGVAMICILNSIRLLYQKHN